MDLPLLGLFFVAPYVVIWALVWEHGWSFTFGGPYTASKRYRYLLDSWKKDSGVENSGATPRVRKAEYDRVCNERDVYYRALTRIYQSGKGRHVEIARAALDGKEDDR